MPGVTDPSVELIIFQTRTGIAPVLAAIEELPERAQNKVAAYLELLGERGHTLRRPHADILRDGICELRIKVGRVNFRVLYFFHGQEAVVLAHFISKEKRVPPKEIDRAIERKAAFEADPEAHSMTYDQEE